LRQDEYETVIIYDNENKKWLVGTNIPKHQKMLEKKGWTKTGSTKDGDVSYEAPKKAITFRDLNSKQREFTDEQKQQAAARLIDARNKKSDVA